MTTRPTRIVDAHVHFWDPARTDWYPYLSGGQQLNMGDVTGMARPFDPATYQAEATGWNVEAFVNVAAATGVHSVDETLHLDRRAEVDGQPAAIIGGLPPAATLAEAEAFLDRQLAASRFRGVRPMGALTAPLPRPEVLRALADRRLLFELMARTDGLEGAAAGLVGHDDLTVVVEHTGWPRSGDDDERAAWLRGLTALAAVGPNVHCKLSGLAMPLGTMDPAVLARWIEPAIELFGVDRCCFASNFPVDGLHGTLDELWTAYATLAAGCSATERDQLFAANAERIYRL
ncbi:MAG: amidohydrolase family protein [Actinomycetota bacterium]|nr:amidohydrolase family protein [Actinomycetota bacterium]